MLAKFHNIVHVAGTGAGCISYVYRNSDNRLCTINNHLLLIITLIDVRWGRYRAYYLNLSQTPTQNNYTPCTIVELHHKHSVALQTVLFVVVARRSDLHILLQLPSSVFKVGHDLICSSEVSYTLLLSP